MTDDAQVQLKVLQQATAAGDPSPTASAHATALAGMGALPIVELFSFCALLAQAGRRDEAIALYRHWLASTSSGASYAVMFNLAVALSEAGDDHDAIATYRASIELNPQFIEAHMNLGNLLERRGEPVEALKMWNKATELADRNTPAGRGFLIESLNNMGRLLEIRKQYPEAEQMLERSIGLKPDQPQVLTHLVHLRQKQCRWPIYAPLEGVDPAYMFKCTSALAMLSSSNDPAELLAAARRFVADKVLPAVAEPLAPAEGYAHQRLRIGYLSSDLCAHAVSILTAELYELHDRSQFEVFAFSWSREDGTPMRQRVVRAMDHYVPIGSLTDEQAAHTIRAHEIDILVDLHGLTAGTRPNILSYRPAPVQMTYLGFPSTTGLPNVDYVLADEFVLPPELAPHFSERPLYLPNSFQINDRQRAIGPRPTRASCALPEDQFVFCSFNNTYKITPELFEVWMNILRQAPNSVLWLVADGDEVRSNLCAAAVAVGVAPERLIFAGRVAPADYLARYQVADLFLDTFPFNGGTTASDALWAGLPVLTCAGRTFASRMAGSLLRAVGLEQMITYRFQDYQALAIALANDPARIADMKRQLDTHRLDCALFDSPRFVLDLEALYQSVAIRTGQVPVQLAHNADLLAQMQEDYPSVVEVGCVDGGLAQAYRARNRLCRYTGIGRAASLDPSARQHCTRFIPGDIEQFDDARMASLGDVRCWIFPNTLERLADPWLVLRRVRKASGAGVEVVASIANAQYWGLQSCLNSGQFVYQDSGALARANLRWFTRATVFDLFQANGYRVVSMVARNMHPPPQAMRAAILQMAMASGADSSAALADALPFEYVVRAIALD